MTNKGKVILFRKIVNEMADLYEKKNDNYGNSFGELFEELGPIAGLVPLHNKLDRATNLVKGGKNDFESLEDTFKDLACYAIMNLIEMEAKEQEKISYSSILTVKDKTGDSGITTVPGGKIPELHFVEPTKDVCKSCWWNERLSIDYVGDVPCQWCPNNPYKITCNTVTTAHTGDKNG